MFTGSTFFGRAELQGTLFAGGASLQDVRFENEVNLTRCTFRDFANRAVQPFEPTAESVTVDTRFKVKLPDGWHIEPQPHSTIADVRIDRVQDIATSETPATAISDTNNHLRSSER
jgi:hypothetical protein